MGMVASGLAVEALDRQVVDLEHQEEDLDQIQVPAPPRHVETGQPMMLQTVMPSPLRNCC